MARSRIIPLAVLVSRLAIKAWAGFDVGSQCNVATYWGQNSYQQAAGPLAQQTLATYCANTDIDIIPLAFLYQITSGQGGQPVINFANQQNNCTLFAGTQLLYCPDIGADIKTCQRDYGKTILLSIGGATYTEGGFRSIRAAQNAANLVWRTFGLQVAPALRPFGDAVVDGFDFDFESSVTHSIAFAQRLRAHMNADKSKKYFFTAAPQCPFPDAADNAMLNGTVRFDAIFVQFYNNYCGLQSFVKGTEVQPNFNMGVWDQWARTVSKNRDVKIFLGVPADVTGAGSGYVPAEALQEVIEYSRRFESFGGVMMWDASQAYANAGFLGDIKHALTATRTGKIRGARWRV